jgi:hypothetical protein
LSWKIELRIWREEYWKAPGISMKMSEMAFLVDVAGALRREQGIGIL